ncbi:MAG TPA: DHA2 family efflux MFS transporter permease subunit [Thermoleophilaceae bacterium]|nr:DHA2 family efflux MFS transporter permease subunit [Thermoleophilaceae bacterium]
MSASHRGWTLAVVCAATALLLLDVTVVNVALPAIEDDLGASFSELQWVIDAYALALAVTLLTAGSLADRIGRRRMFVGGVLLFTAASAACAAAWSPVALDFARALQGLGAAAMFATSLALLAEDYRGADRGRAFGIWGAVSGAALAIGPLVGGALVDGLGWRWIFWLNLPVGIALAVVALRRLRESRDPAAGQLDLPGAASFSAGLFLLVLALVRGNPDGWDSPLVLAGLIGGPLALAAFVAIELRADHPMLDVRLFRRRAFAGTAAVAFVQSVALYPMFLFLAIYFQDVLGYTPFETGLRLLPVTVTLFVFAPISGRLTAHVSLRTLLTAGLVLIGAGLLLMHGLNEGDDWTALLAGLLVGGAGIGVISPALAAAMVGVLPVERSGLSSGINNTFRQVGIAAGIAGLGAIFQHRLADDGFVAGLNSIFLVAGLLALAGAVLTALILRPGDFRQADSA